MQVQIINTDEAIDDVLDMTTDYRDMNDFYWGLSLYKFCIVLEYLGDPYFKDVTLEFNGEVVDNTGRLVFKNDSDEMNDEMFDEIRNLVCENYTDDIWEFIGERYDLIYICKL